MPEIPMRRRRFYVTPAFVFNESGVSVTLSPMAAYMETVAPTIELGPATLTLAPLESWHVTGGDVVTAANILRDTLRATFRISTRLQARLTVSTELEAKLER